MAKLIDGKEIASQIREEIKQEVKELKEKTGNVPGLAVILVGDNPASRIYVEMKEKACRQAGIASFEYHLPDDTAEETLGKLIQTLNRDPRVHAILIQLPLPSHIDETKMLSSIAVDKDVDGFHPINAGKLLRGEKTFLPCTPQGIKELLKRSNIPVEGQHVVVVGRSNIVGKPLALMLVRKEKGANATVTICHTATPDIAQYTRQADILIAAAGHPRMITADMVKEGVIIIDVGVNETGKTPEGKRMLVGDVDFESVKEKAGAITPVPGGVGPMTIAMLLRNTLQAFKQQTAE